MMLWAVFIFRLNANVADVSEMSVVIKEKENRLTLRGGLETLL